MSKNNKVLLKGVIGAMHYFFTKGDSPKEVLHMTLGTRETYKDGEEFRTTKPVWHNDLYSFSKNLISKSKDFKKDDLVELEAQLGYQKIEDINGNKVNLARLYIKELNKQSKTDS